MPQHNNSYASFFIAENRVTHPDFQYIIHLDTPRCIIKFKRELAMFASFDIFFNKLAEIQWLDPNEAKINDNDLNEFLDKAWNYLCLEDEFLDNDILNDDEDEFF